CARDYYGSSYFAYW
nr:immunoglobulin heavy chain junction region [Mus musculus]